MPKANPDWGADGTSLMELFARERLEQIRRKDMPTRLGPREVARVAPNERYDGEQYNTRKTTKKPEKFESPVEKKPRKISFED